MRTSLAEVLISLADGNRILMGLLAGLFIWALNDLGALPVLFLSRVPRRVQDVGMGMATGIMLAASFTSLILPGIELGGVLPVALGILLGSAFVAMADYLLPHKHFAHVESHALASRLRAVWLFALAVTIHNMPEGLSVGVAVGSGSLEVAVPLMVGMGIQNVPEGLAVSFSLLGTGRYSRWKAFLFGTVSGIVEVPLALFGAALVAEIGGLVPYAMGFAAGAMIYVISDEMIPETHRIGHERLASFGLIAGFLIMLVLDVSLG